MPKTILGEAFEQLKQIPKQIGKQVVKLPVQTAKTAAEQIVKGGKRIDPLTGIEIPSPAKLRKIKKREGKIKKAGIAKVRQVISAAKPPPIKMKKPELPPPVSAAKPKMGTAERKLGISG
ncbi:MAG: hypothetical protein LiPW16_510 [Microgenomates group bacterium LiPW_16]|nr:MAG: hypothetical protein LiPW16_510 [Microgenomates group bacterium LiPW_16]